MEERAVVSRPDHVGGVREEGFSRHAASPDRTRDRRGAAEHGLRHMLDVRGLRRGQP